MSQQKSATSSSYTSAYSDLRFKYQNTEEELYVNMLNHDGERLIWEQIQDNRYKVESQIKYRYEKGEKVNEFEYQVNWKEFHSNPAPG